mmetsp:Transcript_18170/g.43923  ORF Transcript_18170/g.43923 Transcript_18170/m.43923 type:complete len:523 (+) Transcript_18170:381-1949(+)|eukprot:CAMPEP_0113470172 /NCGR_PEP_ID=MMETSP0014_2-20120614/16297_1 /TAXON_ID=2857 /ORGANISM="Nitzschia sp." /LENGTH=522 /DNA_ID=CAMNT_0000362711 /DNA_START=323 /DNA_END=1891 /DNA_ORIENTATION=+ /assembly_acc=CAM_ASM_000159
MKFTTAVSTLAATATATAVSAQQNVFDKTMRAFELAPSGLQKKMQAAQAEGTSLGDMIGRTMHRASNSKPGKKVQHLAHHASQIQQLKNQIVQDKKEEDLEACDPTLSAENVDLGVLGQCGPTKYCVESLPEYDLVAAASEGDGDDEESLTGVCVSKHTVQLHRSLQAGTGDGIEGSAPEDVPDGVPTDSIIGLMNFLCYDFDFPGGAFSCNCSGVDVESYSGFMECTYPGQTYTESNACNDIVRITKDQVYTIDLEEQYVGTAQSCFKFSEPQPFDYCYKIVYDGKYNVPYCEQTFYGETCNSCEFVQQGRDSCIAYDCSNTFLAREGVRCGTQLIDYIVDLYLDFYPLPCDEPGTLPTDECSTISAIACTLPDFSTLCYAVQAAGLGAVLSAGEWTVFAPTNRAFEKLEKRVGVPLDAALNDEEVLTNLLLFHTINNETVMTDDMICAAGENLIETSNGRDVRTLCSKGEPKYVKGFSNTKGVNLPELVIKDFEACNGVVHAIDEVLLDQTFKSIKPAAP